MGQLNRFTDSSSKTIKINSVHATNVVDVTEDHDDYPSEQRVKVEEESYDEDSEEGSENSESEPVEDADDDSGQEDSVQDTFTTTGPGKRSLRR